MGPSENRGPLFGTRSSRIRTPKEGTLIFGNSHFEIPMHTHYEVLPACSSVVLADFCQVYPPPPPD